MKVFLSWSGARSARVAETLRGWIPDVIQAVDPWMSQSDIEAGVRWSRAIESELSETRFGIICITPENIDSPWLNFEAGALAKSIEDTYVCPYLIGLTPANIPQGPLALFQAKIADRDGTWELVDTINGALKEERLVEKQLDRTFTRWWPDLEDALRSLPEPLDALPGRRPVEDMVSELLDLVRSLVRSSVKTSALGDWISQVARPSGRRARLLRNLWGHYCQDFPADDRMGNFATYLEAFRQATETEGREPDVPDPLVGDEDNGETDGR